MWKGFEIGKGNIKVHCDVGFCQYHDIHDNFLDWLLLLEKLSDIIMGLDYCFAILLLSIKQLM